MEITEIRIKLMEGSEDRLRAFCSITIDQAFVVRDLKIIDGTSGPFVAMPSRKLTGHCGRCGHKNHLRASYCNHCGSKLAIGAHVVESPQKLYADVAHPINSECREMIQNAVIVEFEAELSRARQPGYRSRYDDEFDAGDYDEADYNSVTAVSTQRLDSAETLPSAPNMAVVPPAATQQNAEAEDIDAGLSDRPSRVVRGEPQNSQTVPRPHFQDRPGGSRGSHLSTSPRGRGGAAGQVPEMEQNDDGFGAGIFDAE